MYICDRKLIKIDYKWRKQLNLKNLLSGRMGDLKAILRVAYSNQKLSGLTLVYILNYSSGKWSLLGRMGFEHREDFPVGQPAHVELEAQHVVHRQSGGNRF